MVETLNCGENRVFKGPNSRDVEEQMKNYKCTTEKQCKEDGKEVSCDMRSMVGPSKDDPKFWIGFVWCACPKDIPKKEKSLRTRSVRVSAAPKSARSRRAR